jgi:hypothetical protein
MDMNRTPPWRLWHRRRLAKSNSLAHLGEEERDYELYGNGRNAMAHATQKINDWMTNPREGFDIQPSFWRRAWQAVIPGVIGTDWEGGAFVVQIYFTSWYPDKPPVCK